MTKKLARERMALQHQIRQVTEGLAAGNVIEHDNVILTAESVRELEADGMRLALSQDKGSSPIYMQDWQGRLRQVFVCSTQDVTNAAAAKPDTLRDPEQNQPRATKSRPVRESGPRQAQP